MPPSYRTIAAPAEDEFIEKKSRFIGYIAPVTTEQEAAAFIESVRARHREARHNCYAYRLRQNNLARFSDDGEPSGTAGRPILEVLQREDLTDVCVVVTRYFGGILLGTGGLARAYTQGCKIAVAAAGVLCMYPAVNVPSPLIMVFTASCRIFFPSMVPSCWIPPLRGRSRSASCSGRRLFPPFQKPWKS